MENWANDAGSQSQFACRVASSVQFYISSLLKLVQGFCHCEWSKIALSHYFGHWLIQQLVLRYRP